MTPAIGPVLVALGFAWILGAGRTRDRWQGPAGVAVGVLTLALTLALEPGEVVKAHFWGWETVLVEVTALRLVFAWAFGIALLLWGVYAWRLRDGVERGVGLIYAGCSLGVVFAGDFLTLFLFWEGMALASTVVILRGRTERASAAAYRYLLVHVLGGILLLVGMDLYAGATGSTAFGAVDLETPGAAWILIGFLINAAAWPLAAWLPDAYPEASPTGTILLGTFTTKTAVCVILIAFAGTPVLIPLGAIMAIYAVIYALGTRNLRRLLAYSLVGQIGYMLCAAGVGGDLGVSGAASHAFMHVLYKSLLFMAAGAVIAQTGSVQGGAHRGLWRKMPFTFAFAAVGAAAIAAFPFTNAFVSKSLILEALAGSPARAAHGAEIALLVASAAAPLYVSLRFLWLAFFGDGAATVEASRAPLSQRLGMGALALLCLLFGVWSAPVLSLLPVPADVHVYAWGHIGKQLLLLGIGTVAFLLWRAAARVLPRRARDPLPDTDALYWRGVALLVAFIKGPLMVFFARISRWAHEDVPRGLGFFARNPAGWFQLGFERLRLAWTGLTGAPADIDRAQRRFEDQFGLYRTTPPAAPWPIGRTVLYGVLLLAIYALVHVLA